MDERVPADVEKIRAMLLDGIGRMNRLVEGSGPGLAIPVLMCTARGCAEGTVPATCGASAAAGLASA